MSIGVIQARDDGGLAQGRGSGRGEKEPYFGYILKAMPIKFYSVLCMRCERETSILSTMIQRDIVL